MSSGGGESISRSVERIKRPKSGVDEPRREPAPIPITASTGPSLGAGDAPAGPAALDDGRSIDNVSRLMTADLLTDVRLVAVGSTNPVKIEAVRAVMARVTRGARIEGVHVSSTVRDQPWGDDETVRGARSRAEAARQLLGADLGIGIEGGVVDDPQGLRTCAWAAVVGDGGRTGTGGSLAMPLPPVVAELVRTGLELGDAMDRVAGTHDVKRGQGAVGLLTAGLIDRQRAYEALITYALSPFLAVEYWKSPLTPEDVRGQTSDVRIQERRGHSLKSEP